MTLCLLLVHLGINVLKIMASQAPLERPLVYRRVFYVAAAFASAYAVSYLHRRFVASRASSGLHRRNAVRRRHSQRRGGISLPSGEPYDSARHVGPLLSLARREQDGQAYGNFRIELNDGRAIDCPLLPAHLSTIERIQEDIGAAVETATLMRQMMEDSFLTNFLAIEFPSAHVIQQETGEWEYLVNELVSRGISEARVNAAFTRFNEDLNFGDGLNIRTHTEMGVTMVINSNAISDQQPGQQPVEAEDESETENQSAFSWRDGVDDTAPPREGQNLLNLLYHIAEDQARRDGYVHRGVTCNSCGAMPIQGIRYRCANCVDFDLCESCESLQVHMKTHLFYKVRIPAPFLGNSRQTQPVWYPGKPHMLAPTLPRNLAKKFMKETNLENTEIDALWDQFRCLASTSWLDDPNELKMAIDRKTFDRCFVPNTSIRPPPPSLIYDRMFAFYDTNGDNLIGFEEFLKGLANLSNKSMHERLRRIFNGYDIDRDGYIERKDFLRIFRAYYVLSRELTRDIIGSMEDDFVDHTSRDVVLGSQPISSAFAGPIPAAHMSRAGEGKELNSYGDLDVVNNEGVLRKDDDDIGDRNTVIGDAAVREAFGRPRPELDSRLRMPSISLLDARATVFDDGNLGHAEVEGSRSDDEDFIHDDENEYETHEYEAHDNLDNHPETVGDWPPEDEVQATDIISAIGSYVPLNEVTDPIDRARIGTCLLDRLNRAEQERISQVRQEGVEERWRRKRFYIDEEEGAVAPPGYEEDDESQDGVSEHAYEGESDSHVPSMRSRSSSKVRFQDDVTDNEYEIRSNQSTSSRSIPVGERWGGFEIPEVERDIGKEVLYHTTQQGLNELLDILFKPKEDLIMEAHRTRADRKRWAKEIDNFVTFSKNNRPKHLPKRNVLNDSLQAEQHPDFDPSDITDPRNKPLDQLLDESGYAVETELPIDTNGSPAEAESSTYHDPNEYALIDDNEASDAHSDGADVESISVAAESVILEGENEGEVEEYQSSDVSSAPDPTLPQNRPDEEDSAFMGESTPTTNPLQPPAPIYESASTSTSASAPSSSHDPTRHQQRRDRSIPLRLRFQQSQHSSQTRAESSPARSSPSSPGSPKKVALPSPPPSPKVLARWSRLNKIEQEAKERGGSGAKLDFEEFAARMQGERGKRLGFVGSWIDMTSF